MGSEPGLLTLARLCFSLVLAEALACTEKQEKDDKHFKTSLE